MRALSANSPVLVLTAVQKIYAPLNKAITAAEWKEVKPDLDGAISILSDSGQTSAHSVAALSVVRSLSRFEPSREMFAARLAAQDAVLSLVPNEMDTIMLARILAAADIDAPVQPVSSPERGVSLKPGGIGGGKSIKLKNFHLDFVELLKIGSSSAASLHSILGDPSTLVIVASALTILQSLVTSVTKTISEDDASLFWSIIQTAGKRVDKTVSESELRDASEKDRREFGLDPFKPQQFTKALRNLESLSSLAKAGEGQWRLIESYRVSK
jgi:hypothetical protein